MSAAAGAGAGGRGRSASVSSTASVRPRSGSVSSTTSGRAISNAERAASERKALAAIAALGLKEIDRATGAVSNYEPPKFILEELATKVRVLEGNYKADAKEKARKDMDARLAELKKAADHNLRVRTLAFIRSEYRLPLNSKNAGTGSIIEAVLNARLRGNAAAERAVIEPLIPRRKAIAEARDVALLARRAERVEAKKDTMVAAVLKDLVGNNSLTAYSPTKEDLAFIAGVEANTKSSADVKRAMVAAYFRMKLEKIQRQVKTKTRGYTLADALKEGVMSFSREVEPRLPAMMATVRPLMAAHLNLKAPAGKSYTPDEKDVERLAQLHIRGLNADAATYYGIIRPSFARRMGGAAGGAGAGAANSTRKKKKGVAASVASSAAGSPENFAED